LYTDIIYHIIILMNPNTSYYNMAKDSFREKLLRLLSEKGFTEFEIGSRREATVFLFVCFYSLYHNVRNAQQTLFLAKNDIMEDEEWEVYIDTKWGELIDDRYLN